MPITVGAGPVYISEDRCNISYDKGQFLTNMLKVENRSPPETVEFLEVALLDLPTVATK